MATPLPARAFERPPNPYIGPRPFEIQDADRFFGRERETAELFSLITAHRTVLLYSQSGVGKSSLLNAKLIPLLERSGFELLPVMRPRLNPQLPKRAALEAPRVAIFDQFEELFTTYHGSSAEQTRFFEQLAEAMQADSLLRVLLVMREDYLARLDSFGDLLPEELRTRYRLERLRTDAALRAIKEPLKGTGISFDADVAEALVSELGAEFVEPVQLQVVCYSLYDRLPVGITWITRTHLNELGNISQALRHFYEDALAEAVRCGGVREDALRRWFEAELITENGTRGMAFRGRAATEGIPNQAVDVLERQHLIRAETRGNDRWYELSHDRFIEPIQRANDVWRASMQKAKTRRLWAAIVGMLILVGCIAGLAVLALWERQQASLQSQRVEDLRLVSTWQSLALQVPRQMEQRRDDELAALLARQAFLINSRRASQPISLVDDALHRVLSAPNFSNIVGKHLPFADVVAFSPDGYTVASGGGDTMVRVWDLRARNTPPLVFTGHNHDVTSLAYSPDGHKLASGSSDASVRVWNLLDSKAAPLVLTGPRRDVWTVAYSPDGYSLASGSGDKMVRVWDLKQPSAPPLELTGHRDEVWSVAFSPDGHNLASASMDHTVRVWDLRRAHTVPLMLKHPDEVWSVAYNLDGTKLATGSSDKLVRVWDLKQPDAAPLMLKGHERYVVSVKFSPDGLKIASGSWDGTVRLWSLDTPPKPLVLKGHTGYVWSVAFSPDSQKLASASWDTSVRLWTLGPASAAPLVLKAQDDEVLSVAYSADGLRLASGSADKTARVWNVNRSDLDPLVLRGHTGKVYSVAFSRDGQKLATGSGDTTARVWDLQRPDRVAVVLKGQTGRVYSVAFSPDGKHLASGSADTTARIWDIYNPEMPGIKLNCDREVNSVAYSPDGLKLACGSDNGKVQVWDLSRPFAAPLLFKGFQTRVSSVIFSPDGKRLAAGGLDSIVLMWDSLRAGAAATVLAGHRIQITSVAFSPDGKKLASGSEDHTIRLWELHQPEAIPSILDAGADITSLAFSPDGRHLASGTKDHTVQIWSIADDLLAEKICHQVWRNLTMKEWLQFVGEGIPYERTCPDLPAGEGSSAR